jgi:hypothetical protein
LVAPIIEEIGNRSNPNFQSLRSTRDFTQTIRLKPDVLRHYFLRIRACRGLGNAALAQQDQQQVDAIMRRRVEEVLQRGQPVLAYVIQAFLDLYFAQHEENAAAMVLISFEPRLGKDETKIGALKGTTPADPQEAVLARVLGSEQSQICRRLPVPVSWADGAACYVADLYVHRPFLPNRSHAGDACRPDLACSAADSPGDGVERAGGVRADGLNGR